jgi:hypothetical protein
MSKSLNVLFLQVIKVKPVYKTHSMKLIREIIDYYESIISVIEDYKGIGSRK